MSCEVKMIGSFHGVPSTIILAIAIVTPQICASIWDMHSSTVKDSSTNTSQTSKKLRSGIAYRANFRGENPCNNSTNTNLGSEKFALVAESIVYGLGSHAKDVPVPCISNITMISVDNRKSVTVPVVQLCSFCANNKIYLSPPAFHDFGLSRRRSARITFDVDQLQVQHEKINTLEPWENIPRNDTRNIWHKEIKVGLIESVQRNTLKHNEGCDLNQESIRVKIMEDDYSHLFKGYPGSQDLYELRYKLMKSNHLEGSFCNAYQNLLCGKNSTCTCIVMDASDSFSFNSPNVCLDDITETGKSCLVDMTNYVSHEFGVTIPQTTNECWYHSLCALLRDGERCTKNYMKLKRLANFTGQNQNQAQHEHNNNLLVRFPLVNYENSTDCVCMESRMLQLMAAATLLIFWDMTNFTKSNTLEWASDCDPAMEQLKKENLLDLRALDNQTNPLLFADGFSFVMLDEFDMRSRFRTAVDRLVSARGKFCKTYKHLMCEEPTSRCGCYSNPDENIELARQGDACVLQEGSICDPAFWSGRFENYVDPYQEDAQRPACVDELPCVDYVTGDLCPRNSSYNSFSFKDKIFPYLDPRFKQPEHLNEEPSITEYCRCGNLLKLRAPSPWWTWALLAGFGCTLALTLPVVLWYKRKLSTAKNFLRSLPASEQRIFLEGDQALFSRFVQDEGIRAQFRPYDSKQHEIPRSCVKYGAEIGEGGFGVVMKGTIMKEGVVSDVAIKKCSDENDLDTIRAFVVELKILQYVGRHDNVVRFMGAITENTRAPELVLEYCQHGSLEQKLKLNRTMFLDQIIDDEVCFAFTGIGGAEDRLWSISTSNLLRWAIQIANGMEYLSEKKKVVHGDLFLKNVLVAANGVAKITDFGLSRRFAYNGKSEIIRTQEGIFPLPHLLPPEVKRDVKKISSLMDVWTFGILLWEMFTLGREPDCIISAEELLKPAFATTSHYSIIRSCWACKPNRRPGFSGLKNSLLTCMAGNAELVNARFDFTVNFIQKRPSSS